jgi:uncharacterized membrane protein YgaE (UPF0421/DUF939 family)
MGREISRTAGLAGIGAAALGVSVARLAIGLDRLPSAAIGVVLAIVVIVFIEAGRIR